MYVQLVYNIYGFFMQSCLRRSVFLYKVSEIIFTLFEAYIFIVAFSILSNQKNFIFKQYLKTTFFVSAYTIYTYCMTYFIPRGLHSLVIGFITILALNLVFNGTLFKSIVKTFIVLFCATIIETVVMFFGILLFNKDLNVLLQSQNYVFVCSVIVKAIEIIILLILLNKKDLTTSWPWLYESNPHPSKFSQLLLVITSVLFIMVTISIYISNRTETIFNYYIFSFVIYVVLIVIVYQAFREGTRLEIIEFASDLKKENIQQLIEFNEMVAKERHEYKNHLNTIYGLCTLNKPDLSDKVKQYINNYANNSDTRNIVIDSGNDFVDAIINVKYNNALRKGVDILVDFDIPLSAARIDENAAVTIISNIIENAFESLTTLDKEKKYINVQTYIENNIYFISISNNGPMISEADKKKIFNAGFSTKDNTTKKRGFGLSIVLAEIENCGGDITINSTEEVTEFLISLRVNEQQAVV